MLSEELYSVLLSSGSTGLGIFDCLFWGFCVCLFGGLAFGVLFYFVFSQYLTDVSCSLSSVLIRNEYCRGLTLCCNTEQHLKQVKIICWGQGVQPSFWTISKVAPTNAKSVECFALPLHGSKGTGAALFKDLWSLFQD